jgi:hypothetical protein
VGDDRIRRTFAIARLRASPDPGGLMYDDGGYLEHNPTWHTENSA